MSTNEEVFQLLERYKISLKRNEHELYSAQCILDPVVKNMGNRIGASLRGVLLSHIPGYAISAFCIPTITSEYDSHPAIRDDITEMVMNLKEMRVELKNSTEPYKTFEVSVKGKGIVFADIFSRCEDLNVLNPELKLMEVVEDTEFLFSIVVSKGTGFTSVNIKNSLSQLNNYSDFVAIDNICYSPVLDVNYRIEPTESGQLSAHERVVFDIRTKGGQMDPREAFRLASSILANQILPLTHVHYDDTADEPEAPHVDVVKNDLPFSEALMIPLASFSSLGIRVDRCLENLGVKFIGDLLQFEPSVLLKKPNFGTKSLITIQGILKNLQEQYSNPTTGETVVLELGRPHSTWNRALAESYFTSKNNNNQNNNGGNTRSL